MLKPRRGHSTAVDGIASADSTTDAEIITVRVTHTAVTDRRTITATAGDRRLAMEGARATTADITTEDEMSRKMRSIHKSIHSFRAACLELLTK